MAAVLGSIPSKDWSHRLGSFGDVVEGPEDVAQCVVIILTTPRGSSPYRPLFGCDAWRHLDKPLAIARPRVVQEVLEAIELWETRAKVRQVQVLSEVGEGRSGLRLRLTLEAFGHLLRLEVPLQAEDDPGAGYVKAGYVNLGYVTRRGA